MASTFDVTPAAEAADKAQSMVGYVVDSNEMAEIAAGDLRKLTAEYKRVEEMRFAITRPLDESKKQAMAAFKPYLDKISAATDDLRANLNSWLSAERERVEAEERAAREEAARREAEIEEQRRAAAAAFDAAQTDEEREAALAMDEAAVEQQELDAVAPNAMVAPAQKLSGISQTKRWKLGEVDLYQLVQAAARDKRLLSYLKPDLVQLGKEARAMGDRLQIPGVEVVQDYNISVRS